MLFSQGIFSQVSIINTTAQSYNNQVLPSTQSLNFGKYGDYKATHYNGSVNIAVDFKPLETKFGYKVPISINFNQNGIKVNDMPTTIGVGWNLIAGGVVTRTINGLDDFGMDGWFHNPINDNLLWSDPTTQLQLMAGSYDTQPDDINFSTPIGGGEFQYEKHTRKMLFKNSTNFAIDQDYQPSGTVSNTSVEFSIQDAEGNIYEFLEKEIQETYSVNGTNSNYNLPFNSASYLSRILLRNDESILFEYENLEVTDYLIDETESHGAGFIFCESWNDFVVPQTSRTFSKTSFKFIKKISYKGYEIDFHYSDIVLNIANSSKSYKKLDRISYSLLGSKFYEVRFEYAQNSINSRFWISKIYEVNYSNSLVSVQSEKLLYQFFYNNIHLIPDRFSRQQDYWGYYNNNQYPSLVPIYDNDLILSGIGCLYSQQDYFNTFSISNTANRQSDSIKTLYGNIQKIVNQLGGETHFDFQVNRFSDINGINYGAGARIMSISNFENGTLIKKTIFNYGEGKLMTVPKHSFVNGTWACGSGLFINLYLMTSSKSTTPLSYSAKGRLVGYTFVSEIEVDSFNIAKYGYLTNYYKNDYPTTNITSNHYYWLYPTSDFPSNYKPQNEDNTENGQLEKTNFYEMFNGNFRIFRSSTYSYFNTMHSTCVSSYTRPCLGSPSTHQTIYSKSSYYPKCISFLDSKLTSQINLKWNYNSAGGFTNSEDTTFYYYQKLLISNKTVKASGNIYIESFQYLPTTNLLNTKFNYSFITSKIITYNGSIKDKVSTTYDLNFKPINIKNFILSGIGYNNGQPYTTPALNREINIQYFNNNETIEIKDENELTTLKIINNLNGKVHAIIKNCFNGQGYYSNFDNEFKGNWIYSVSARIDNNVVFGKMSFNTSLGNITSQQLPNGKYILTFWSKNSNPANFIVNFGGISITPIVKNYNGQFFYIYEFTNNTNSQVSISGNGILDELVLMPHNSEGDFYSYLLNDKIGSHSNGIGLINIYEYDANNQLLFVKNNFGEIEKKIIYNIKAN